MTQIQKLVSHTLFQSQNVLFPNKLLVMKGSGVVLEKMGHFTLITNRRAAIVLGFPLRYNIINIFFGEPPVTSFDDTRTRTWAGHKVDRNFGMVSRTSEFLKQVYSQERQRREHSEDQAKLLRKFRKKHITRNEMMRRKPLRNKRALADRKKRRAFYDRSRLKTAPPSAHGRRHLRMIGENIHEKFTWQKSFSPVSQDLVSQGPELNQEQRMRKPNPRRGRAVGYWNKKFLNLNLRSPNYTACGNIE